MEDFQHSLESFFSQHFHFVPMRTNRQDQWYKRSYQSWKEANGDAEPLLLTPKDSREDWVPELQRLAGLLMKRIQQGAEEESKHQKTLYPPPENKLFGDEVLDCPMLLSRDRSGSKPLEPRMQRLSYWASRVARSRSAPVSSSAIKALLECEQITPLLHLARHPQASQEISSVAEPYKTNWDPELHRGWGDIVEEMLGLILFLTLVQCFPETLMTKNGFRLWLPFALPAYEDNVFNSAVAQIFDNLRQRRDNRQIAQQEIREKLDKCFRVLVKTHVLYHAFDLSVRWEQRIIDRTLYYIGFEAWNRSREGQSYLGCDLNAAKDAKWIKPWGAEPHTEEAPATKISKPQDPLLLREAKKEPVMELTEEEQAMADKLADLEMEEVAYGLRRSHKYRKRS